FSAYPPQFRDVSYGRDRGNPNVLSFFPKPTPGAANVGGGPDFSPPVVFSRPAGTFVDPFTLTLSAGSGQAQIHYTTDGTLPTEASPVYSGPISVNNTLQVRAMSTTPGLLPGTPSSATYLALSPNVLSFSSGLPVVVLHNFGAGRVPAGTRQFASVS